MKQAHLCPVCLISKPLANFQNGSGWCRTCRTDLERRRRASKGVKPKRRSFLIENTKLCLTCNSMKTLEEFSPAKRGLGGRSSYCRSCVVKRRPRPDAAKVRTRVQSYRERHRERHLAGHRVIQFKRRHRLQITSDGSVTDEFLKSLYDTSKCHYCRRTTLRKDRTADHRVPLKRNGAHSATNLVMACLSCNSAKGAKTESEFKLGAII